MEGSYYENHRQEIYRRLFLDGGSFLSLHGKKKIGFVLFWGRNMFGVVCCWNFPPLFLIGAFRSCNYSACPPPWIPSLVSVPTLLLTGMRGSFKNLKHFKRKKKKKKNHFLSFFFLEWRESIKIQMVPDARSSCHTQRSCAAAFASRWRGNRAGFECCVSSAARAKTFLSFLC